MNSGRCKAGMPPPLSPLHFNILMTDLKKEIRRVKWEVNIERKKMFSLTYVNDVVLMAKKERKIKSMLERLEGYLGGKRLELNAGKTKIMRFKRRGRRVEKKYWR